MDDNSKVLKKGFFKKVWYSIFKLERYGEMAAEGVPRAIFYTIKLALIVSIVVALGSIYQLNGMIGKGKTFIEEQVGEFSYKDGILQVVKDEPIRAPSSNFGEIVINTKIESEEDINKELNSFQTSKGILILKDRIYAKGFTNQGTITYKYIDVLKGLNINEADNQKVIDYLSGGNLGNIFIAVAIVIIIYMLLNYFLQFLWNAVILSIFGFIATFFTKIKMRYAAIFNMACYSFTLSILLQTIYIAINIFWSIEVKYFQMMFIAIAAIYLIAAIFLIKAEFIKQKIEEAKMSDINKKDDKQEDEEDKEKDKSKDTDKPQEKEQKKEKNNDTEPNGSEA